MTTGCLNNDTQLDYIVEFHNDDNTVLITTSDPSVELDFGSVDELNDLELPVRIVPSVPQLRLFGTPQLTTLTLQGTCTHTVALCI